MIWCHVPQQWLKIASKLEYHMQTKQMFWEQMTHILFLLCLKRTGILYYQYNRVGSGIPHTDRIKWWRRFQLFFSQPHAMDVKLHSLSLTQFTIRICCFKTHTKFVGVHTPMVFSQEFQQIYLPTCCGWAQTHFSSSVLLYIHRDHKDYYGQKPRTSTWAFTQLLSSDKPIHFRSGISVEGPVQ